MKCFNLTTVLWLLLLPLFAVADEYRVNAVYPTHWWAGMKYNKLQLMLYGSNIAENDVRINDPRVTLHKVHRVENRNYLFVDISIAPNAGPGKVDIVLKNAQGTGRVPFNLYARRPGRGTRFAQGLSQGDLVYLLMPDRFSNGDYSNDRIPGLKDQSLNRDSVFHRHGGDLQGVIDRLDYLQDLGVTALWMTPVIQNDMPDRTEHGYAFTNHYRIEPRLGGEQAYKKLSDELHRRGMKLVQDAVYNHVGLHHFTVQDLPMKDWLHQWPQYTNTTYKDQPLMDPYAAASDRKRMSDGWFTPMMPDLNQSNPYVANFLIQHAIWCVEEFGVDAWRIDTYIYNDLAFMNRCNQALLTEYPKLHMFGETWVHGVANQAYFTRNRFQVPFKSNLPGVTDFQTNLYGINPALTQPFGWTEGVNRLYNTLANDFVYEDPTRNVNFLDNHDMTRFYTQVGGHTGKLKMGIGWLLTTRGIPQIYYGTEIGMTGSTHPSDGYVRLDFKGGWKEDAENKFTAAGRNATENEIFHFTRTLARFRKQSPAITKGALTQYVPGDGLYVYFRHHTSQTVMCVMNTMDKEATVQFDRYAERTKGFTRARNVLTGAVMDISAPVVLGGYQMLVLELQR